MFLVTVSATVKKQSLTVAYLIYQLQAGNLHHVISFYNKMA